MAFKLDAPATGRVGPTLAEINVVPLVDVVLVLLLIFMLTAPMMYRGIDVQLPRTTARPTSVEERLVLTVTRDRLVYLNDRPIALGLLEPRLRELLQGRGDRTLYLKADAGLPYGFVVETMDRVRRAGVERMAMVTEPAPREPRR